MADARLHFVEEINRRGLTYTYDVETDRYRVSLPSGFVMVSLANLARDLSRDHDPDRVSRFVDAVVVSHQSSDSDLGEAHLYWVLEPSDFVEKADYRFPISDRVDRVLVRLAPDQSFITWVSKSMIRESGLSERAAFEAGFRNLDSALAGSKLEFSQVGDVRLAFIAAPIPMKASLILAPGFKAFARDSIGWPVLAVAPDRDFLYFWASEHRDFVGRVGSTVVKEYSTASYPVSTEVYEISDEGLRAIGEFEKNA